MKVSLKWLRHYLDTDLSTEEIAVQLTDLGLEVEGQTNYELVTGGLAGLYVGQVVTCQAHPNADKLSLTQVDLGQGSLLQIVCGAPNVAQGQKVVVATVGTRLYPKQGEPFVIKKGKIRGEVSEGMLCAEDEIGLGQSHAGIMVLDPDAPLGQPLAHYLKLEGDEVLEIGLTPNRSDATGHLGVAFDLAAALRIQKGQDPSIFKAPACPEIPAPETKTLPIALEVQDPEACPRYMGLVLDQVQVGPSPEPIQHLLRAIGLEPINNVVDLTNFILHEWGQALHAFDYDAIQGAKIRVRKPEQAQSFTTLDGRVHELSTQDLCICDAQGQALCLAGIYGGLKSGVSQTTKRIFLEAAHFEPKGLRRSSMAHQLRTAAAQAYEKGTDPNQLPQVLARAVALLREWTGAKVASEVLDCYPQPKAKAEVNLRYAQIPRILGLDIPEQEVLAICQALNFEVLAKEDWGLRLAIPGNKVDVRREADVLEELLRIYGYHRVENPPMMQSSLVSQPKPKLHALRNKLGTWLTGLGYAEMMGLSLIQEQWSAYWPEATELIQVHNTANQHLSLLRPSLLFNGLEVLAHNRNRQQEHLRFFEWGKTYLKQAGVYTETEYLALTLMGSATEANWLLARPQAADYYELKSLVEAVLALAGFSAAALQLEPLGPNPLWAYGAQYRQAKQELVSFGRVKPDLARKAGLKTPVFYAEFKLQALAEQLAKHKPRVEALAKFPALRRDLAFVVDTEVAFETLAAVVRKQGKRTLKALGLFDVYEHVEQLGANKKSYALSLVFQDETKTLEEREIEHLIQRITAACERELGAVLRKS